MLTACACRGKARARRRRNSNSNPFANGDGPKPFVVEYPESRDPEENSAVRSVTPGINLLPSVVSLDKTPTATSIPNGKSSAEGGTDTGATVDEAPEVAALLLAQRARTPVAIAVGQDCAVVPFKVPRPFVVLGWFWVGDAWVSENQDPATHITALG